MEQQAQSPAIRTETVQPDTSITVTTKRGDDQKLASLGHKDENATDICRNYRLPGQESTRVLENGERVQVARTMIDPGEYVIRIGGNHDITQLLRFVQEGHRTIEEGWEKFSSWGKPPLYSFLEIIVGNTDTPETCYRYRLLDAQAAEDPDSITLTIAHNVEHEKEDGAYVPCSGSGQDENLQPEKNSSLPVSTTPIALVDENAFTESQRTLMADSNLPPSIVFGKRTGLLIAHQRALEIMTRFSDDIGYIEVDLQKSNLWVVAANGDAVSVNKNSVRNGHTPSALLHRIRSAVMGLKHR